MYRHYTALSAVESEYIYMFWVALFNYLLDTIIKSRIFKWISHNYILGFHSLEFFGSYLFYSYGRI